MDDNEVFLVSELWIVPDSFDKLKIYRRMINTILEPYNPEIVFHNHVFEWVRDSDNELLPTGVEVVRFNNEKTARAQKTRERGVCAS